MANESSGVISVVGNSGLLVESAWTELVASAVRDTNWAQLFIAPIATHSGNHYLDLAIGASGSEAIILRDFYLGTSSNGGDYNDVYFALSLPLKFTTGDRISARYKDEASGFAVTYKTEIRIFD